MDKINMNITDGINKVDVMEIKQDKQEIQKIQGKPDKIKRQIRYGVFETNSSSVHTIVYSNTGMEESKFKLDKDGKIHVKLDIYFGSDECIYNTQEEKLVYLFSFAYDDSSRYYDIKEDDEYPYEMHVIERAIMDYVEGCTGIIIDKYTITDSDWETEYDNHFDHQTSPHNGNSCIVNLWDDWAIQTFVFNKNISLKTDCD